MGGENVVVGIVYAVPARFRRCATFPRLARQAATNLADGVKRHILQIYKVLWSEQAPSQYLVDLKCTAK